MVNQGTLSNNINSLFFPASFLSIFLLLYLHIFSKGQIPQLGFAGLQISLPSRIKLV
jgi:hypothetical protein